MEDKSKICAEGAETGALRTLSQIFDALSYYTDHRDEIEQRIVENIVEKENT